MQTRISEKTMAQIFARFLQSDHFEATRDTSLIFYDLNYLTRRITNLIDLFPASALHAIAVKANPLPKVLDFLKPLGVGAEAATFPELYLAESSSYNPSKIVFDSPAKTYHELEHALQAGIHLNADSFKELDRIAQLRQSIPIKSTIGLRINPQIGTGKIALISTAGRYSKFGVPLNEFRERIKQYYGRYDWLTGVHLHIGSQSYSTQELIQGIKKVYNFIEETNQCLGSNGNSTPIDIFDIGGGMPVSYRKDRPPLSLENYKTELAQECPKLFSDKYKLITEFGRYIHANTGWVASKVEYVKEYSGAKTVVIHVGADLFMRRCYLPEDWYHEITVFDKKGQIKPTTQTEKYMIVGPLCFSGDILARNIELPKIEEGDYVILQDTGAYTLSIWNRHLSRQVPKVMGYFDDTEKFIQLKAKEKLDQVKSFWS